MLSVWGDGECGECGAEMKILNVEHNRSRFDGKLTGECKQCQLLAKFERIAHALELQVGIE